MVTQNNDHTVNRDEPAIDPEENSFTPDFEPEEHESPDTTKEERQTGELDKDIDTAGG